MRYFFILLLIAHFNIDVHSQSLDDFEILIKLETTPLNDQQGSGTCWSFATTSFIETEAIRLGKEPVTLSPMYYVTPTYLAKAEKFMETQGEESWFSPGDLTFSVLNGYKDFGAIPETVYKGIVPEDWRHDQVEMDNLLFAMMESVGTTGYGRIKPNSWKQSIEGVLAAYIGMAPDTFFYENKVYSPQSFAQEFVGINPDEYIEVTSYTHHNFYEMVTLDIPANWSGGKYLNLPIEEFEVLIDHALESGYSLAWDGDASEPNFDFETGIATLSEIEENVEITQQLRQETFEDETTTDDHNMHIVGKAKSEDNHIYYILKNSEGSNSMGGYIYLSKKALLLKTISLLVNKEALPIDTRDKLAFKLN